MRYNNTGCRLATVARGSLGAAPRIVFGIGALLAAVAVCPWLYAGGDPVVPVMHVEEDWEVVLNEPGEAVDAPQFHTVMSAFGDLGALYTQIMWNYRELPDFCSGGLQIQAWNGEEFLGKRSVASDRLSTSGETISWTQVLNTTGTRVSIRIENGQSTTWGSFGGYSLSGGYTLVNLNGYSPSVSAENSWITHGANRVELLRIKEVRWYDAEGNLVSRDQTPRVVYESE